MAAVFPLRLSVKALFPFSCDPAFALRAASLTLPAQPPHPRSGAARQFGMIPRFPSGMFTLQKPQQLAALYFLPGGLEQKGAAPARPYQIIDFLQEIAGDQDVCSLCACHMCVISVP